jgi:hypothetical protein
MVGSRTLSPQKDGRTGDTLPLPNKIYSRALEMSSGIGIAFSYQGPSAVFYFFIYVLMFCFQNMLRPHLGNTHSLFTRCKKL